VFSLPFGHGRQFANTANKVVNAVVGGWQVSPIVTVRTGFPLALANNTGDPTGTFSGGIRPDCNGTNTIYGRQNYTETGGGGGFLWFDPKNYTNNTSGFGNCAPSICQLRGPGYYDWDISLQKNFQFTEWYRLEFRTHFLNAFNGQLGRSQHNRGLNHHRSNPNCATREKYPVRLEPLLLSVCR
jgi:hypothetical protein